MYGIVAFQYNSIASQQHLILKISLGLLVTASSLACIVLPSLGAHGFFAAFEQPYSAELHLRLLAGQIVGASYTLLLASWFTIMLFLDKRVSWRVWLVALIGGIYEALAVGGLSHDFSHSVFEGCSGIYGTWITAPCILGVASLVLLAFLTRYHGRGVQRIETLANNKASSANGGGFPSLKSGFPLRRRWPLR